MIEKIKQLLHLNKPAVEEKNFEERIDDLFNSLGCVILTIELGTDLISYGDAISQKIWELREKIKDKSGFIIPGVRILDNTNLQENEYQIKVREKMVFNDFTVPKEDYLCNEIITNLENICKTHIDDVFAIEEVEKYLEFVQRKNSWLVWYVGRLVPITGIKIILTNLLKSGKSIKDISFIFEKICEHAARERDMCFMRDPQLISEYVKRQLG